MRPLNDYILRLSKRAEKYSIEQLVASFVDVGPLFTLLSNTDNQIIFGRRGTGKTHVLSYLNNDLSSRGITTIQVDMRTMGSTGGIYSDPSLPIAERASRLLSDALCAIHDGILEICVEDNNGVYDLSRLAQSLDNLAEHITAVTVSGTVTTSVAENASSNLNQSVEAKIGVSNNGIDTSVGGSQSSGQIESIAESRQETGAERLRIHFGAVTRDIQRIVGELPNKQLWVLLDEWSEIPLDLQPFLADLLRRTLYPVDGVTVKIAAIEQRCNFRQYLETGESYIGIEIGADASASLNLDEFMVFDNNDDQAKDFFGNLLYKHVRSVSSERDIPQSKSRFINDLFTQQGAFEEFVRASEGVPRDAINIASLSAQKAMDKQISIPHIRESARNWFHRSKNQAISSRDDATKLLEWIINEVIGQRQARAFLLRSNVNDPLISLLYDARILHLLKQGVSAQLLPGQRFNVYALDYGCYVDLIATTRAPKGLLIDEMESGEVEYIEVPKTDFRSIRNSVLDLDNYYQTTA